MTEAERDLLIAIAEYLIDEWRGSAVGNDLEWRLTLIKDEKDHETDTRRTDPRADES
jgi:hypothetical protein